MRASILVISLVIGLLPGLASDFSEAGHPAGACANRGCAEEYLGNMPLLPVEGIWEYPADEVALMVVRDPHAKGRYGIYLLESVDCRLTPGMRLGWIEESAQSNKFRIGLSSRLHKGLPAAPNEGLATLTEDGESLLIEMPKLKVSLAPAAVLPVLWNKLRLFARVSSRNPLDRLPEGWVRKFPSYDSNGSQRKNPRYL